MVVEVGLIKARVVGEGVEVGNWNAEVEGSEEIIVVIVAIVWSFHRL